MTEAQASIEKVSETSPAYEEQKEIIQGRRQPLDYVFGSDVWSTLDNLNRIPVGHPLRTGQERRLSRSINRAREQLGEIVGSRRSGEYVEDFFEESLVDPTSPLSVYVTGQDGKQDSKKLYDIDSIPEDVLQDMIVRHVNNFRVQIEEFNKQLPFFRERFQRRFAEKIVSKGFIDQETFERRMASVEVVLGDALRYDLTSDRGGNFDSSDDRVMIAEQEFKTWGEHIYTHEMLHALSGRTIVLKKSVAEKDEKSGEELFNIDIETQRVGLRFKGEKESRFQWLNEAITEFLTRDLTEDEGYNSYSEERELYGRLRTKGKQQIPEDVFFAAYFENYDPNIALGKRIPLWKKLYSTINESYRSGYLLELDQMIQSVGVHNYLLLRKKE